MTNSKAQQQNWIATCPKGLEALLADEMMMLGAEQLKETVGAVSFIGNLELAYKACLWSRLANRILLPLSRFDLNSADELYTRSLEIPWEEHLSARHSIRVDFAGTSRLIDNTRFGAQRVKDALVDRIRKVEGGRPDVALQNPDVRIHARLNRGVVTVSLDLAGESLHRRGYAGKNAVLIKENLAAALLVRSGWPALASRGYALLDPVCGDATLLIEGVILAAGVAPGTLRAGHRYGFLVWKQHREELWQALQIEAERKSTEGLGQFRLNISGYEATPQLVQAARDSIERAGLQDFIHITHKPPQQFGKPTAARGLLLTSPPGSEAPGQQDRLLPLYTKLGQVLQKNFGGWRAAVFTSDLDMAYAMDLSPTRQYRLLNGKTPARLLVFDDMRSRSEQIEQRLERAPPKRELSDGAQMLLNRLEKNERRFKNWLKQSAVSCYRLYDADIPEYAVAIDLYGERLHVQEYRAPASIPEHIARERFAEVKQAIKVYQPQAQVFYKERRKQKGRQQYDKKQVASSSVFVVTEGPAKLEVNLSDYLDTGLFLDHRPVRKMIRGMAKGKRFLNLFCYTAAASIHAALGGAEKTLSIDMSNTYLDWARRNFELNGLSKKQNPLMRADCLEWLKRGVGEFDLIFLDPPTFSNSSKMRHVLDIQRDHAEMIHDAMLKLSPGGTLLFSNNFRKFKMDEKISQQFAVVNMTDQTFDPDFKRNPRIHNVWKIAHR